MLATLALAVPLGVPRVSPALALHHGHRGPFGAARPARFAGGCLIKEGDRGSGHDSSHNTAVSR